jgi:hypothetical protein
MPEQLLIAHLFPHVFVFKLYPKNPYAAFDIEGLQNGLRGNVSSHELDMKGMVSMVQGNLMPKPPVILSSLISVTYIGRGRLPKNWLKSTFRVRRQVIGDALLWLKENNPKYFGDIEISGARLSQLPEDDIPVEILGTIRQTSDTDLVELESAGYTNATSMVDVDDDDFGNFDLKSCMKYFIDIR